MSASPPYGRTILFVFLMSILGLPLLVACNGDDDDEDATAQPTLSGQITVTPTPALTATGTATEGPGTTGTPSATETPEGTATEEPSAAVLTDPSLQLEAIEGLTTPTQIAFLGPNDLLVAEKTTGRVMRVTDGEVVGPVVQLATNFADERGVLGITLHPQFSENNYVYIYWTWSGEGEAPEGLFGEPTDDLEQVAELGNRVDRFVWDGQQLTFDQNIVELPSRITDLTLDRRRGNHNGGVIDFGPDGKLYIVIGDQNERGQLTNVEEGDAPDGPEDLVASVLRLNDDGSVPEDNPFVAEGDPVDKIWVYGVRNSYGFDWDAAGNFWLQANGQAAYDEAGIYTAGANMGWIQIMGPPERFDEYKEIELPTDRQLDNPEFPPEMLADSAEEALQRLVLLPGAQYQPPLVSWKYAVAPTAMHFVPENGLPGQEGALLMGDVNTGSVYRFETDANGLVLEGPLADGVNDNTPEDLIGEMSGSLFAGGIFVVGDIETGPDGTLWITSIALNTLYAVRPGQ